MQANNGNIIERLFASFGDLEKAIDLAAPDEIARLRGLSPEQLESRAEPERDRRCAPWSCCRRGSGLSP